MSDEERQYQTQRRRAFAAADRAGLTDEERCELAEMLLKRDISSWSELAGYDWARVIDALDGWHLVDTLHMQRSVQAPTEAGVVEGEQPTLNEE